VDGGHSLGLLQPGGDAIRVAARDTFRSQQRLISRPTFRQFAPGSGGARRRRSGRDVLQGQQGQVANPSAS
jgi:hypothetical protein